MRNALADRAQVVDLGVRYRTVPVWLMKAAHARRADGRWVSTWKQSTLMDHYCAWDLSRHRYDKLDMVVEIGDLAVVDGPFALYQDMSYDALLQLYDGQLLQFPGLNREAILRRRERQRMIYERASLIFAMSRWFADALERWSDVDPSKVRVLHPGTHLPSHGHSLPRSHRPAKSRRQRLLFVGRDFVRKGGDLVLAALAELRRDHDPEITLTVAGPAVWTGDADVPEGVDFLGSVSTRQVARLLERHDLFVMPSRFEGFGIAFAEALSFGVPCVARDDFAMPELIRDGHNGGLVRSDRVDELVAKILSVLTDDSIYDVVRREAGRVRTHFSWERAGEQVVREIATTL
ncbi:MAG: glycosyltransferase family 4 protein [Actinobacteria bacterium]|nr:glycosyltransferase family 4 protein [Actinomycetota bacterium]